MCRMERPAVIPDVRLRERGLGIFQGKTPREAAEAHPDVWKKCAEGNIVLFHPPTPPGCVYDVSLPCLCSRYRALQPVDFVLPGGGESAEGLYRRVSDCINDLATR
jgi:broad specificity phosphatase PhoE